MVEWPTRKGGSGYGDTCVVDGDQVTIGDFWCGEPARGSESDRYTWTWNGTLLEMTPLGEDDCSARQAALAEMTLVEGERGGSGGIHTVARSNRYHRLRLSEGEPRRLATGGRGTALSSR